MEKPDQQSEGTTNNVGQSQASNYEANFEVDEYDQAAHAGAKNDPYISEWVPLDRTTIDSDGRRSMAYLHKPTGRIIPETERHDTNLLDQSLRDHDRRQDILQCWALCETVKPEFLRTGLRYLVQPVYWLCVILSLLIMFWDGYQQNKKLHSKGDTDDESIEKTSEKSPSQIPDDSSADDEFSDIVPLEKTALDAYGRRSMAFLNNKTGKVITSTDITEHYVQDPLMRKHQRRTDVAYCLMLCENVGPEILRTVLRAVGLPFFLVFLGVDLLLLERDVKRERKDS